MTRERRFIQCDVFSSTPAKGNALAVVVDGEGLTAAQMQDFAAWTNLAETTFLLPPTDPQADYQVRIFTTTREMPFAGHPTLGSCAAWLHSGGTPHSPGMVRQQCQIGLVEIDTSHEIPAFIAPPTRIEPLPADDARRITDALNLQPEQIDRCAKLTNGPVWQVFALRSAEDVLAVDSSSVGWPGFQSIGLIGPHPEGHECDYEVRMLAPSSGMSEDPITGSLNSALSHWLASDGLLGDDNTPAELTIAQGTKINRHGRVFIRRTAQHNDAQQARVMIGGHTSILITGTVVL